MLRNSDTFRYNLSYILIGHSWIYRYSDVTLRLKSSVAWLFVQPFIQANNKGNIEGAHAILDQVSFVFIESQFYFNE